MCNVNGNKIKKCTDGGINTHRKLFMLLVVLA